MFTHKGKIKFFDKRKNNFGFITDIISQNGAIEADIYFSGNDIICPKNLISEMSIVVFSTIVRSNKLNAINISSFQNLSLSEKKGVLFLLSGEDLLYLSINLIINGFSFSEKEKNFILDNAIDAFRSSPNSISYRIINFLDSSSQKKLLLEFLNNCSDFDKIKLINDSSLLNIVSAHWQFEKEHFTDNLIREFLKDDNSKLISESFIKKYLSLCNNYSVWTNVRFFSLTNDYMQFYNYLSSLNNIDVEFTTNLVKAIQQITPKQSHISFFKVFLKVYKQIPTKLTFLAAINLLKFLIIEFSLDPLKRELYELIINTDFNTSADFMAAAECASLVDEYELIFKHLARFYSVINQQLTDKHKISLLTSSNSELIQKILSSWEFSDNLSSTNLFSIIYKNKKYLPFAKEVKRIVHNLFPQMPYYSGSSYFVNEFLEYVKFYNDTESFELFINTTEYFTAEIIAIFVEYSSKTYFSDLLRDIYVATSSDSLKAKIELLSFLTKSSFFPKKDYLLYVTSLCNSFLQQLIIKRIVYYFSMNKNSFQEFHDLVESINFTDLSSLLLKNYIISKPADKISALNMLSNVFKLHLERLKTISKSNDTFENLYHINILVKDCHGRKLYNKNLWQKEGIKRYYVDKFNFVEPSVNLNIFCEGRFWKTEELYDSVTKKSFQTNIYWCRGDICYCPNNSVDTKLPSADWTLLEISKILKISLEPLLVSYIAGWANRMNEIVDKLKCTTCNSFLRPKPFDPKILGHYAVPLFYCLNDQCQDFKKDIRFTHCLNSKCGCLLDSRELKQCTNNWLICPQCGSCCPEHSGIEYSSKFVEK